MDVPRFWGRLLAGVMAAAMPLTAGSVMLARQAAAEPGCANGQPDASPVGKGEQVIVDYFKAVDNRDYVAAWGYLDQPVRAKYGDIEVNRDAMSLSNFSEEMREHLKCVRVTKITVADSTDPDISASRGIQWYQVTFDAEYITPFEGGAGTLPSFYKTRVDPQPLIIDEGMSP